MGRKQICQKGQRTDLRCGCEGFSKLAKTSHSLKDQYARLIIGPSASRAVVGMADFTGLATNFSYG